MEVNVAFLKFVSIEVCQTSQEKLGRKRLADKSRHTPISNTLFMVSYFYIQILCHFTSYENPVK